MHGKDPSVSPIEGIERAAIFLGEFALGAEFHACGRTQPNVHCGGKTVGIIRGPVGGARTPAIFAASDAMDDSRWPVPGQSPVPFHVAIKREHLTFGVEVEIVRISESGKDKLPLLP